MDSIDKYIKWIIDKTESIQKYTKSLNKPDVSLTEIKELLSKRLDVTLIFNPEIQRYKRQLKEAQREYRVWWGELYTKKRRELNPTSLSGNKWSGKADIEAEVITENKETYISKIKYIEDLEDNVSFMRGLLDNWKSIQMDLTNLVKILAIEAQELNMTNRVNNTYKRELDNNFEEKNRRVKRNEG